MLVNIPTSVQAILPEILLLVLGVLVLILDPFWKDENRRNKLGWLVSIGIIVILIVNLLFARPSDPLPVFGSMLRFDWLGFVFKMFILLGASISTMFFMDVERLNRRAEAYLLLLAATLGMCLMVSASDLVMLYLSIETTSIPLYVLAGFMVGDEKSTEAGFKYLLFGALTSVVMLYGFSLLYGFSGTTNLYELSTLFTSLNPLSLGVLLLVFAGLAFKISIVPFHFWAPDVYEGSPTPVAGFLSTTSKAAGFIVLLRLFFVAFPGISLDWSHLLAVLATVTMTIGNLIALTQKNIKRLLAYSSIAHAGYALIGVAALSQLGVTSTVFYLIVYILTNLAAFGIVVTFGRIVGSDEIIDYAGLSRRAPYLALVMLVAFLSLAGMPPFGGFVAKVLVFTAAVKSNYIWLAVVGVLNSIVGLYYYLTVLKYVYLYRAENEEDEKKPLPISKPYTIALIVLTVGIIVFGTIIAPWFGLSSSAAHNLF